MTKHQPRPKTASENSQTRDKLEPDSKMVKLDADAF